MPQKYSIKEKTIFKLKELLKIITNNKIIFISGYENKFSILRLQCLDCHHIFEKSYRNSISKYIKCSKCGNGKYDGKYIKFTKETLQKYLVKYGLKLDPSLDKIESFTARTELILIDDSGYYYTTTPRQLKAEFKPTFFNHKYAIYNIKRWISINRPEYELISNIHKKEKLIFKYNGKLPPNIDREFECGITHFMTNKTEHPHIHKSKGENKIEKLLTNYNIKFIRQYEFENCRNPKTNRKLPFDFYLPDYNKCIEFDGNHHYSIKFLKENNFTVPRYHNEENYENTKYRDEIKNIYCFTNNIELIRIPFMEKDNIETTIKLLIK